MDPVSLVSSGLIPGAGSTLSSSSYNSLLTSGLTTVGSGITPTPASQTVANTQANASTFIPANTLSQLNSLISIKDPYGHTIVPSASGYIDLGVGGNGLQTGTNSASTLFPNNPLLSSSYSVDGAQSFTGTDLRIMIETATNSNTTQGSTFKQLIECHTISVSSYRSKNPVRSLGYTNPKGFSRGPRTLAGTMVLTEMSVDVLLSFLQAVIISDNSKDSNITKADQLPPFNITMVFANEDGAASYRRLLGVEFLNDGVVYSVQDLLIERTISWMATDFTPLLPLNVSDLFKPSVTTATTVPSEATPEDYMTPS